MSVSMRSTKAQMYSEIERLREQLDRVKHSAPRATHQVSKQSLAQFCAAYCRTHNVRSVPGEVVRNWRAQQ